MSSSGAPFKLKDTAWNESVLVGLLLGLVMAILTLPAFSGFFFGEDFITRGLYLNANGDFLKAIFTPFTRFLRPSAVAWSIATQFLLPWDPFFHHARNLIFDLVALTLLHRILVELNISRVGRLAGAAFFAVSRVHLTLVGYINCIDNIGTLIYELLAILLLLRSLSSQSPLTLPLALVFAGLSCLARDLSFMILLPLLGLVWLSPQPGKLLTTQTRRAFHISLALAGIFLAYLAVRFSLVGLPQLKASSNTGTAYALRFDVSQMVNIPLSVIGMVLGTPIFSNSQIVGGSDFTTILGLSKDFARLGRYTFLLIFVLTLFAGTFAAFKARPQLVFPLLWIVGFCGPLILIGTFQAYYTYEASAATAILVASIFSLSSPSRLLKGLLTLEILIMALGSWAHREDINGMVWRWTGEQVRAFNDQVILPLRATNRDVHTVRLIVADEQQKQFWHYLIDPVTIRPSALPLLRTLLSPSVQGYEVLLYGDPRIDRHLRDQGVITLKLEPNLVFTEYSKD